MCLWIREENTNIQGPGTQTKVRDQEGGQIVCFLNLKKAPDLHKCAQYLAYVSHACPIMAVTV